MNKQELIVGTCYIYPSNLMQSSKIVADAYARLRGRLLANRQINPPPNFPTIWYVLYGMTMAVQYVEWGNEMSNG